jgi:hypothetical protein
MPARKQDAEMRRRMIPEQASDRKAVLAELRLLADGRHSSQQTVFERYRRCAEWKQASLILARALSGRPGQRRTAYLTAPPGWLPPLV